ncbi:DUF4145 domain-containing protein [Bacillus inaquosorum]|uniref:DUF4145 domain-containing protein n=1 Tax=Bacillus inaquosorum TaxID=483913 RepID=UPI00227F324B|nr:DUF4145 domain-containing protein [Bacillus inaquosorum]MCY8284904.1 DUF4145 domain-containing protein [Bacillus inaquosorum]MCY9380444.1 DUF4145 domain-containing protein [Bacillus inaquosorum]
MTILFSFLFFLYLLDIHLSLTEVAKLISSVLNSKFIITILTSWPLAVVIIVLLLRKGILDKLSQLDSFNYKDGTAKFIRDTIDEVKTNQTHSTEDNSNQSENDSEYEVIHPVAAVLEYWIKAEEVINEAYKKLSGCSDTEPSNGGGIPVPRLAKDFSTMKKIDFLARNGVIDERTKSSLTGLRKVRNEVAHGSKINIVYAKQYTELCKNAIYELKNRIANMKDPQ